MKDQEIAEYLLTHPEFFENHAEVLAGVRLTSPHGGRAISLQERQIEMQREKNKQIERRLAELVRYGHENDGIAARLHLWTLRVLSERDPHAVPDAIVRGLQDIFDVPAAALRIWQVASAYEPAEFARNVSEEVRIFANSLAAPYCGENTGFEAVTWLDGKMHERAGEGEHAGTDAKAPASVALLPLRDPLEGHDVVFGLLVMGSPDPRRFHEGMSTDFLVQIGQLASAALDRLR